MFRVCSAIMCILLANISFAETKPNRVRLGGFNYPPFYSEENGAAKGIGVDLSRELFKRLNIERTVSICPISRLLYNMKSGQTDAALFLLKTPERSKFLSYTKPIMTIPGQLWSLAGRDGGAIELDKLDDLKNYRVGVTQGYSYGAKLDSVLKTIKPMSAYSDYANYKLLLDGRIDAFPGNEIVAKSLFKKYPELTGKFVHAKAPLVDWEFHIAISKKSPLISLIPEINKHIENLRQEGVIDRIVSKYTD